KNIRQIAVVCQIANQEQGRSNKRGHHETAVGSPAAPFDKGIASAQKQRAQSVETGIDRGQVGDAHAIASCPDEERGTAKAWSVGASSAGAWNMASIIPQLKMVPQSRLKAPHRTWAVATSAALLLQMVAAPRPTCRQISPH